MTAHKGASGFDGLYYHVFVNTFILYNNEINFLPTDNVFESFLGTWELHRIFKPTEREMGANPKDWTWQENPIRGYKNDKWMKKHLELLIEENYERELNGIFYEFSFKGNHIVNKIKSNMPNKYFWIMEKVLAMYERKLFGNNDIQNTVYLKYEKKLNDKINSIYSLKRDTN